MQDTRELENADLVSTGIAELDNSKTTILAQMYPKREDISTSLRR